MGGKLALGMILALETSTEVCSAALMTSTGERFEKRAEGRGVHSTYAPLFTHQLLDEQKICADDLDAVLFSGGPGSYTGLRIGASFLKGLLYRSNVPLYMCSTLMCMAAATAPTQAAMQAAAQVPTQAANATGNVSGSVTGSTTGSTTGNATGTVTGTVTGSVAGNATGSAYANVYGLVDARRSHLYCQTFEWKHLRKGWETKEGSKQTLVLNSTSAPGVMTLKEIQSSMPPDAFLAGTGLDRLQLPDTIQKLGKAHISALNLFTLWEMPNRSERFTRVNIGLFEPEYVTMTQTNHPVT